MTHDSDDFINELGLENQEIIFDEIKYIFTHAHEFYTDDYEQTDRKKTMEGRDKYLRRKDS